MKIKERERELTPQRLNYAVEKIKNKGFEPLILEDGKELTFLRSNGKEVRLFVYTGWWSGKGIGSGRGINNLLKLI